MPMKRADLVETLKKVAPALSSKDLVPAMSCFFFNGETVAAFDDLIAIEAPCKIDFTGGLRGKLLLDFLTASRAPDLEFADSGVAGEILIKAGRSRLKMPVVPLDDFQFKWPEPESKGLPLDDKFFAGLKQTLPSMGRDPSSPWSAGVTFAPKKDGLLLFSTNNIMVSESSVAIKPPKDYVDLEVVLPPQFVEQLLSSDGPTTLMVTKQWAMAKSKDVRFFSSVLSGDDISSTKFQDVLSMVDWKDLCPVPKGLLGSVERALVVAQFAQDPLTVATIKEGILRLVTTCSHGEVKDAIKVTKHEDATGRMEPTFLKNGLLAATEFRLYEGKAVAFKSEGLRQLISVFGE